MFKKIKNLKLIAGSVLFSSVSVYGYRKYNSYILNSKIDKIESELYLNHMENNNTNWIKEEISTDNTVNILNNIEIENESEINFKIENITIDKLNYNSKIDDYSIIFFDLDFFKEKDLEKIKERITNINNKYNKSSKKLKLYYKKIESLEEIKNLENNFNIEIVNDGSLNPIFLKHKYFDNLIPISIKNIIYNKNELNHKLRLMKHFNSKFKQEDLSNYFKKLGKENIILLYYLDKNKEDYKNKKKEFYKLITGDNFSNNLIKPYLITNKELLIDKELLDNNFYMIIKNQPNIINIEENSLNLDEYKFAYFPLGENTDKFNLNKNINNLFDTKFIFNNNIFREHKKYQFSIEYDKNQINKDYILNLFKEFKKLKLKLIEENNKYLIENFNINLVPKKFSETQKNIISINCQNLESLNNQMEILHYNTNLDEYKKYKKFSNYFYEFPLSELTPDNLLKFMLDIYDNKLESTSKSQKPVNINKFSNKINGKNFKSNICDSGHDNVIFYYSKNCGSCKRFLPIFENLSYDNLKHNELKYGKKIKFNRINYDKNYVKDIRNYTSTPILAIFKKEYSNKPIIYKSTMLNRKLMENFIESTLEYIPIQVNKDIFFKKNGL